MRVYIKQKDIDLIIRKAEEALPNECCGIIGGRADDADKYIERVFPLTNTDASPEHFTIDPKEQLAVIKELRADGLVPLGNYHSHPATPARLSDEDIRLAKDPDALYLVLSLAGGAPVLKAFTVTGGAPSEASVIIE